MEVINHEALTPARRLLPLESESGVGCMSIPYVKFFTSDWIAGCSAMDPFEELLYLKICLHNWDSGLPITEAGLSRLMRGHEEGITGALAYLLESGKITKSEDGYASERAVESFNDANKRRDDAINAAAKRWKSKGKKDNAPEKPSHNGSICQPELEPELEPIKKDIYPDQQDLIPPEPEKKKEKRAAPKIPFPVDWVLPDDWRADAIQRGMRPEMVGLEAKDFQSYHTEGGEKRPGWRRSWTTWVKNHTRDEAKNDTRAYNKNSNNGAGDTSRRAHAAAISGPNAQHFETGLQEPIDITPPRVRSIDCAKQS